MEEKKIYIIFNAMKGEHLCESVHFSKNDPLTERGSWWCCFHTQLHQLNWGTDLKAGLKARFLLVKTTSNWYICEPFLSPGPYTRWKAPKSLIFTAHLTIAHKRNDLFKREEKISQSSNVKWGLRRTKTKCYNGFQIEQKIIHFFLSSSQKIAHFISFLSWSFSRFILR